jgi:hypothetical protein
MTDLQTIAAPGVHDFDFFAGDWTVRHRQLKRRLAGDTEWVLFGGATTTRLMLGGLGNIDENVIDKPGGAYEAITLRLFDPSSGQWSIWWVDARNPGLEPPVRGCFRDGVGAFFGDDELNGRPIKVRFIWSQITAASAHWEQAFSADAGQTWETNWTMDFTRLAS